MVHYSVVNMQNRMFLYTGAQYYEDETEQLAGHNAETQTRRRGKQNAEEYRDPGPTSDTGNSSGSPLCRLRSPTSQVTTELSSPSSL